MNDRYFDNNYHEKEDKIFYDEDTTEEIRMAYYAKHYFGI